MEGWEIKATKARIIARDAPMRKLREKKKEIMEKIQRSAEEGSTLVFVRIDNPEVRFEIENWLNQLEYVTQSDGGILKIKW